MSPYHSRVIEHGGKVVNGAFSDHDFDKVTVYSSNAGALLGSQRML